MVSPSFFTKRPEKLPNTILLTDPEVLLLLCWMDFTHDDEGDFFFQIFYFSFLLFWFNFNSRSNGFCAIAQGDIGDFKASYRQPLGTEYSKVNQCVIIIIIIMIEWFAFYLLSQSRKIFSKCQNWSNACQLY